MAELLTPKYTSIQHAVRWIAQDVRFLSYNDAWALKDYPDIEGPEFKEPRQDLLLALRHGLISSVGNLEVYDRRYSVYEDGLLFHNEKSWDEYLNQYAERIKLNEEGRIFVGHSIPIPGCLWHDRFTHWNANCLHYSEGQLQCRFFTTYVLCEELTNVFCETSTLTGFHSLPKGAGTREAVTSSGGAMESKNEVDPYRTGGPGKPTIIHLIRKEMVRRNDVGLMAETLADEARQLQSWANRYHPNAPSATEKTIKNQLRAEFNKLKKSSPKKK